MKSITKKEAGIIRLTDSRTQRLKDSQLKYFHHKLNFNDFVESKN